MQTKEFQCQAKTIDSECEQLSQTVAPALSPPDLVKRPFSRKSPEVLGSEDDSVNKRLASTYGKSQADYHKPSTTKGMNGTFSAFG